MYEHLPLHTPTDMSAMRKKKERCRKCLFVEIPVLVNLEQRPLGLISSLHDGVLLVKGSFDAPLMSSSSFGPVFSSKPPTVVGLRAGAWKVGGREYGW